MTSEKVAVERGRRDGRMKASEAKKLQAENADMVMTLVRISQLGGLGARKGRTLARECLARVGGEGAS